MTNHSVGHTSEGDNEGHGFQIEYTSNKLGLYIYDLLMILHFIIMKTQRLQIINGIITHG